MDKNNIVYHGSPVGNLKEIFSSQSTHMKKCIYASKSKVVAFLFMGKGNGDLDIAIFSQNGQLCIVERRKGVLKNLYDKSGYLYVLNGETFNHYDYLWSKEVISFEEKLIPICVVDIENILEELFLEEKLGNIKIYKYPSRPENIPLDNSDLINKYINYEKKGLKGSITKLLELYPEFENKIDTKLIK